MKQLTDILAAYVPLNEQEEADRAEMLRQARLFPDTILTRENRNAHFTASSWIVSRDRRKVLMAFHRIYQAWSWTGGHADGESDLLAVALREAREETGITSAVPVMASPLSLEILCVNGHEKKGLYVPSHLHLNVTFLLEADETEALRVRPEENSAVRWFGREEAERVSSEAWMFERVYRKVNGGISRL